MTLLMMMIMMMLLVIMMIMMIMIITIIIIIITIIIIIIISITKDQKSGGAKCTTSIQLFIIHRSIPAGPIFCTVGFIPLNSQLIEQQCSFHFYKMYYKDTLSCCLANVTCSVSTWAACIHSKIVYELALSTQHSLLPDRHKFTK